MAARNRRSRDYVRIAFETYSKRRDIKAYLELVLSLGAIILFLLLALRPTALTISQLLKDISAKETLLAELNTKVDNLKKAEVIYSNEDRINLITEAIPTNPSPEGIVRQIETLANTNQVTLGGLAFGEAQLKGGEGPGMIEYTTVASGAFESLTNFLSNFVNLRRPKTITALTLSKEDSEIIMSISSQSPYK